MCAYPAASASSACAPGPAAPAATSPSVHATAEVLPSKCTSPPTGPHMNPKIRILLADDHAVVRQGFKLILAAQPDMEIIGEAGNGREAVELAEKLQPEVVVMDVAMPELNGIEATR